MENAKKFFPLVIGVIVAVLVFIISKKFKKNKETAVDRSEILEKAREAKLAKSILRKSDDEESTANFG